MNGNGSDWAEASQYAVGFLSRYGDARTRELRDDIAQEAVLMAWRWSACPRRGAPLRVSMQTITRRHRLRAISKRERAEWLTYTSFGVDGVAEPAACDPVGERIEIDGRSVPLAWAKAQLRPALACLSSLDRQLLLGFHEGFCCTQLAQRFGRTRECVKSRVHRARQRLRRELEDLVRVAGDLSDPADGEGQS